MGRLLSPHEGRRHRPVRAHPPPASRTGLTRAARRPRARGGARLPRALQKRKSAARRIGGAALAPNRAPGAQAVRLVSRAAERGRTRSAKPEAPVEGKGGKYTGHPSWALGRSTKRVNSRADLQIC